MIRLRKGGGREMGIKWEWKKEVVESKEIN